MNPDWYKQDEEHRDNVVESEGVGAELELEESQGYKTGSPGDENGEDLWFLAWNRMSSVCDLGLWDDKK